MIDDDDSGAISGMNTWQGKPKYSEKTCPSAALSITDPTGLAQDSNPGRHGRKAAINRLRYGTTFIYSIRKILRMNIEWSKYVLTINLVSSA
jgi:hypothetical protein